MDTQPLIDLLPQLGLAAIFVWFFVKERESRDKERADAIARYDKNDLEHTTRHSDLYNLYIHDMSNFARLSVGLRAKDETRPVRDIPIPDAASYQDFLDSRQK